MYLNLGTVAFRRRNDAVFEAGHHRTGPALLRPEFGNKGNQYLKKG